MKIIKKIVDILERNSRLLEDLNNRVANLEQQNRLLTDELSKAQNNIVEGYNSDSARFQRIDDAILNVTNKQEANDRITFESEQLIKQIINQISEENGFVNPHLVLLRKYGEELVANVNSIFSYCQNKELMSDSFFESDIFKYYKGVHEFTKCKKILNRECSEIRLGREHDGGYVMVSPFSSSKVAYSLGICDDVSWDTDMARYGYQVFQYDHTIDELPESNPLFTWKKIGLTGLDETDELKHLSTLIEENGHSEDYGMVLKMDIEGYEWDIFVNESEDTLNHFEQIVLELHGMNDLNQKDRILKGLKKLTANHSVVHVHANNYRFVNYCGKYVTPDALELTLIRNDLYELEDNKGFINDLDQVNNRGSQDAWLERW